MFHPDALKKKWPGRNEQYLGCDAAKGNVSIRATN
jgi:hypothetical protein